MGKAQVFRLKGITEKNEHDENGTEQFFKRKLNFYALLHTEVPPEETLPPTHWPSGGELADRRMGCHPPPGPCHVGRRQGPAGKAAPSLQASWKALT